MSYGLGILALGELSRVENEARRRSADAAMASIRESKEVLNYVFRAKSHVHGLRAAIYGHRIAEDKLIEALKLENANHPLASREAVEAIAKEEGTAALFNPEVIKKTYPDGKLPEGAVTPPNLTEKIA
jgi:hypothetical protein